MAIVRKEMYIVKWPEKGIFRAWVIMDTFTKIGKVSFPYYHTTKTYKLKMDQDFVEDLDHAKRIVSDALAESKSKAEARVAMLDDLIAQGPVLRHISEWNVKK